MRKNYIFFFITLSVLLNSCIEVVPEAGTYQLSNILEEIDDKYDEYVYFIPHNSILPEDTDIENRFYYPDLYTPTIIYYTNEDIIYPVEKLDKNIPEINRYEHVRFNIDEQERLEEIKGKYEVNQEKLKIDFRLHRTAEYVQNGVSVFGIYGVRIWFPDIGQEITEDKKEEIILLLESEEFVKDLQYIFGESLTGELTVQQNIEPTPVEIATPPEPGGG